jgi:hypothetical protein
MTLGADGCYRSEVFSGLWLDPAAMTAGEMIAVLDVLAKRIASAEHTAFVARLRSRSHKGGGA